MTQRHQVNIGVYRTAKTYIARCDILPALSPSDIWTGTVFCYDTSMWPQNKNVQSLDNRAMMYILTDSVSGVGFAQPFFSV